MKRVFRVFGFMDILLAVGAVILAVVAAFTPGELRVAIWAAVSAVVLGMNCAAVFTLADEMDELKKTIRDQKKAIQLTETRYAELLARLHTVGANTGPPAGDAR